jgi:hypothetical protein
MVRSKLLSCRRTVRMNKISDFDLKTFQSDVFQNLGKLRAVMGFARVYSKGIESIPNYDDFIDRSFSPTGLFARWILAVFSFLGKGAKKNILDKPEFKERERRSAEILDNPRIKEVLCRVLRKEVNPGLFLERVQARIVRVVTASLTETEIAEELSIEKDAQLFSLMIYKIWQKGVGNYCG